MVSKSIFTGWFPPTQKLLQKLPHGPFDQVKSYNGCFANGYRFHCEGVVVWVQIILGSWWKDHVMEKII